MLLVDKHHLSFLIVLYSIGRKILAADLIRFFSKRANFAKNILLNYLGQIYPKIAKNIYFEILSNLPSFLRNEKKLGLGKPILESGTPAALRSLKMLPIDFSF